MSRSPPDFVRQQGFTESEPIARQNSYAALMFHLEPDLPSALPSSACRRPHRFVGTQRRRPAHTRHALGENGDESHVRARGVPPLIQSVWPPPVRQFPWSGFRAEDDGFIDRCTAVAPSGSRASCLCRSPIPVSSRKWTATQPEKSLRTRSLRRSHVSKKTAACRRPVRLCLRQSIRARLRGRTGTILGTIVATLALA